MPPPITTTVAPRRILAISSPSRQHAAGSASAAVAGSSPSRQGMHALLGEHDALREAADPHGLRALADAAQPGSPSHVPHP